MTASLSISYKQKTRTTNCWPSQAGTSTHTHAHTPRGHTQHTTFVDIVVIVWAPNKIYADLLLPLMMSLYMCIYVYIYIVYLFLYISVSCVCVPSCVLDSRTIQYK